MAAKGKHDRAAGAPGYEPLSREAAHAAAAAVMGEAGPRPDAVARRDTPRQAVVVALRTFGYQGDQLDRGQVFRLAGAFNDKRLVDLRYCAPLDPGQPLYECAACGCSFVDMGLRDGHARLRHVQQRFVPPPPPVREPGETIDSYQNRLDEWAKAAGAAADADDERRDRIENEVAPLDLTKTAASRA